MNELMPMLSLEGVTRVYESGGRDVLALGPVDVEIGRGEFVAIMGPSGSGKSTLLSLSGALDLPTEGRVLIEGADLALLSPSALAKLRRQLVGYVFQDLNLLPGLTALENAALPLELDGMSQGKSRNLGLEALKGVGLQDLAHRFPDDLSGGEQQRVAVARSFVGPRSLLLADEPTGALDSVTGERVMRLLRAHCDDGKTVVLVTHDSSHAAWADRVLFLRDGLVVDETSQSHGAASPGVPRSGPTGVVVEPCE